MLRALAVAGALVLGGGVAATRVLGGGSAAPAAPQPALDAGPVVTVQTPAAAVPQVIPPGGSTDPAALLASLLVTYPAGSPCASVAVQTPVATVPPACAAAWAPYHVTVVPGQDLLRRTPRFPGVSAGPGVTPQEAIKLAAALWRTKTFQAFALGSGQLTIEDGLGADHFFLRAGAEELAAEKGDRVTTPLCHFFPTQIRVVEVAPDLRDFEHGTGRVLGVKARFLGPCYATATDSRGASQQIFSFTGADDVVFIGTVGSTDPLSAVLSLTGLGDCTAPVAKATCAT